MNAGCSSSIRDALRPSNAHRIAQALSQRPAPGHLDRTTALPADPSAAHVVAAVLLVYANSWLWHGGLAIVLSRPQIQRAYLQHYRTLTRFAAALVGMFGVRLIAGVVQEFRARTGGAA